MTMLHAQHITKSYGSLPVLKDVSLEIKKGEVIAIVGASGAGKSTLLHILGTLDRPDQGQLHIAGQNIRKMNNDRLATFRNSQIGFVFQFHNLLPEFTAKENICIPAYIGNRDTREVDQQADKLMGLLGITGRSNHAPAALSGGEQQRTAVARALINSPAIVFADEPSGNLDSANAEQLHRLFFHLRDNLNQTFVIVTHNETFAQQADRRLEIKDGRFTT